MTPEATGVSVIAQRGSIEWVDAVDENLNQGTLNI